MFLRFSSLLLLFWGFQAFAYINSGVEGVNPVITLQLAKKEGLIISDRERSIKKELLKLKRTRPQEFEQKLSRGIENPDDYQGYLLEIRDGLQQTEKAKTIAKYELYKKIQKNWPDLKMTVLNSNADKSFKEFRYTLIKALNEKFFYVDSKQKKDGYHFQIGLWGLVTVSPQMKTVKWRIMVDYLSDGNKLEKGAEDIKIDKDSGADVPSDSDSAMPDSDDQNH